MATSWGQELKRWREEAELSRPALARLAHVSVKNIYNLETQGQRPNSGSVTALVDALDRELAHRSPEWVADGHRRLRQGPPPIPSRVTQSQALPAITAAPAPVPAATDDVPMPDLPTAVIAPADPSPTARPRAVWRLITIGAGTTLLGIGLVASGSPHQPALVPAAGPPAIPSSMTAPRWYLANDPTSTRHDGRSIALGQSGDVPLVGDWDGDGRDTPAVYRPVTDEFVLGPSPESPRILVDLGTDSWPLSGDWNGDGRSDLGYYVPGTAAFVLLGPDDSVLTTYSFGPARSIPVVGDWDGDGRDEVGSFSPTDHRVVRRSPTGPPMAPFEVGAGADMVFSGNWDSDPADEIGYYRRGERSFVFLADTGDTAGSITFGDGQQLPLPVTGDWNGDGVDTQGAVQDKDKG